MNIINSYNNLNQNFINKINKFKFAILLKMKTNN